MSFKKIIAMCIFVAFIIKFAESSSASIEIGGAGITITGCNGSTFTSTFSDPITEYLVAAFSCLPSSKVDKIVSIQDNKVVFHWAGLSCGSDNTLTIDKTVDGYITVNVHEGINDIGTLQLFDYNDPYEKETFDYKVGVLFKIIFNYNSGFIADKLEISGNNITYQE